MLIKVRMLRALLEVKHHLRVVCIGAWPWQVVSSVVTKDIEINWDFTPYYLIICMVVYGSNVLEVTKIETQGQYREPTL